MFWWRAWLLLILEVFAAPPPQNDTKLPEQVSLPTAPLPRFFQLLQTPLSSYTPHLHCMRRDNSQSLQEQDPIAIEARFRHVI